MFYIDITNTIHGCFFMSKKIDILSNEILDRKMCKDKSKKGYNFVGSKYHWTSIEEQKIKVNEIENINKNT